MIKPSYNFFLLQLKKMVIVSSPLFFAYKKIFSKLDKDISPKNR